MPELVAILPDWLATDRAWLWLAAAAYFAGFVLGTVALLRDRRHSHGWMYAIIAIGYVLQTTGLYLRGLEVKGCPLGNTFEIFQFTAWSAITLYLVIGPAFRLSLLGYFTCMLTTTLSLTSLAIPSWDAVRRVGIFGGNAWIEFHAALALFSYGVFGLLALTSIMYLLQVFSLKRHHLRGLFSFLPPVRDLDQMNLRLLATGVALLAASLAVGSAYWLDDTSSVNAPKLLVTIAVWLAYATACALRIRQVLLAKRLAWTCIILFAVALGSLGPVNSSRQPVDQPAPIQDR
ncbi:MAG: cytochrome c biogenesis protein CcsA [Verrucomicrobiota bacterium]